jgi:maltooligosyltrehalose synthase
VTQQFDLWLTGVKRDVEMPDLWAQLRRRRELLAAISDDAVENRPFTDSEQRQIAEQLQELKEYVGRTYSLSDSQMRVLEERLDYLIDAARRAGRRDWLLMVAGVMLSYVLAVELPPEAARAILNTFLKGISRILGREFPELPGG